jgi:hypothetical protein
MVANPAAESEVAGITNRSAASDCRAGPNLREVSETHIMFDNRARIHNAMTANASVRVHYCFGKNDGTLPDGCSRRDPRGLMNNSSPSNLRAKTVNYILATRVDTDAAYAKYQV